MKKIVLFFVCFLILSKLCLKATDGFAFWKIQSPLCFSPDWTTDPVDVKTLLDQPFFYLGHGAQCYAFLSKDGAYVLKFYRHDRAGTLLAPLSSLFPTLHRTIEKREKKRLKAFSSYMLAYTHLREKTGLLYLHLNPTEHLQKKLTLYDKIGVSHQIDLDQTPFILQKWAKPVYCALEDWTKQGELDKAKEALTQLVSLLAERAEKGLFDKDPDLRTNFGFTAEGPIQFDIGRYSETEEKLGKDHLIRITDQLSQWLQQKEPSLAAHLQKEIQAL